MIRQEVRTYTLPPSSFELTVITTDPIVTREMTRENTFIDCSGGDLLSAMQRNGTFSSHQLTEQLLTTSRSLMDPIDPNPFPVSHSLGSSISLTSIIDSFHFL